MSEISPPAGHALGSPAYRRLQAALVCAGIACFAQLYSPQGILQLISADLDIGAERAALTVSAATGGLALAVMPWSFVGDRIGRRPAMIAAVGSATVLALLAAWSPSVPLLLGLRFLEGAALGGVPALAMAYLSEEVDARARAVAAGWFVAGTTLGGLSGRILATPVADLLGWRAGMTAVVLLAVLAATGFTLLAPRERRFAPRAEARGGRARRLLEPLRDPGQIALLACAFLLMGGFVAIYNYLAFHLSAPPYLLPAALIGLVLGTVVALVGLSRSKHPLMKIPKFICAVYVTVVRGTPMALQLFIMAFVVLAIRGFPVVVTAIIVRKKKRK